MPPRATHRWGALSWPGRYWARQSLRARLTLLATALFSLAVATGAVLVVVLQRYALVRVLDSSAHKTAVDIAKQLNTTPTQQVGDPTGGVAAVQVLDARNFPIAASPGADRSVSYLTAEQFERAKAGGRFDITLNGVRERVVADHSRQLTVVVFTDLSRVDDSVRILTRAALIGAPIAVLLVGLSMYFVVALTLRSVGALRNSAAKITAAGLAGQRLPVPGAQDEIYRLALTLNEMLDRIEGATARQRTFTGDAAHELRSPLASLRVQLEVAQRIGPDGDWPDFLGEVLIDVGRLDRLVEDLLTMARLDETGGPSRRDLVDLGALIEPIVSNYEHARVPVTVGFSRTEPVVVLGDRDALHRVVVNLIDNAVRYARTAVVVEVRADRTHARLTVTDDGPGLPEDERELVFDRFYRAELSRSRDSGGTGLGLPIVRDVVRLHHGTVQLTSRADGTQGLQALVILPLDDPPR